MKKIQFQLDVKMFYYKSKYLIGKHTGATAGLNWIGPVLATAMSLSIDTGSYSWCITAPNRWYVAAYRDSCAWAVSVVPTMTPIVFIERLYIQWPAVRMKFSLMIVQPQKTAFVSKSINPQANGICSMSILSPFKIRGYLHIGHIM